MGRPKTQKIKAGEDVHLSVVVDGSLVQALDREAERMTAERPGVTVTRTDALRVLLHNLKNSQTK